ncbi:cytochrome P450 3A11-like [Oppia nitens]|uniref:cytochrome P450 3A11-like n=1 Tax=Oppia nitens TaxID=1686743 RepID=UPI0023D9A8D9|nr:cytochrome P450 3A11-like [Oppia nitens]
MIDYHNKYGNVYGTYFGSRPVLYVSDPQLIKQMNIKDFNVFIDRNDFNYANDLLHQSLFNMKANEWKNMRSITSPTFSSGKMRSMHPIVVDCVHRLDRYLEPKALNRETIEMKKTMGCLTMDVIAACAFGTQIDTYDDQKPSEFVLMAQKVFSVSLRSIVYLIMLSMGSKLLKITGFRFTSTSVEMFFKQAIQSIIAKRQSMKNNRQQQHMKHKDYLQLILDAKDKTAINNDNNNKDMKSIESAEEEDMDLIDGDQSDEIYGQINDKSIDMNKLIANKQLVSKITDTDILASSFQFLVAGYETTGSLLALLIYRLALDDECQRKLFQEISEQFNGQYDDYDSITRMPYLEACIAETLRLYNPLPMFGRMASQDYTIESIGLTIPKGMLVNFDIESIHHNPDYYPEPDCWNPDRFMPENRRKLVPYTYMPFGLGPRNCVGMRFALMEAKTAVVYLVNKYRFFRTPETKLHLKSQLMRLILDLRPIDIGIELRD